MTKFKLIVLSIIWPWRLLYNCVYLYIKAKKLHKYLINFIEADEYLYNFFNNTGFVVHNKSLALVNQTKLPADTYMHINGDMEEIDSIAIIEYYMTTKLETVYVQLEKNALLDIITVHNVYKGDGVVITIITNIYNTELNELRDTNYVTLSIIFAILQLIAIGLCAFLFI